MPPFTVSQAAAHELLPACRLLFADASAEQSRDRLLAASEPTGLFVARGAGGKLRAAALVQALPGALGLAWPPRGDSREAEDAVTAAACRWLRSCGVKVCQAFTSEGEAADMFPLERAGFRHTTQLVMLRRALNRNAPSIELPKLGLTPKLVRSQVIEGAARPAEFDWTLLATHDGTRDCPELNAPRTPAEILAGFTPSPHSEWYLVERGAERIGAYLMEIDPRQDSAELSYIGVVPEQRERGFGAEMLKFILGCAELAGMREMTVSVDARNAPAMKLYARHGFVEYDRRGVWLASWPASGAA